VNIGQAQQATLYGEQGWLHRTSQRAMLKPGCWVGELTQPAVSLRQDAAYLPMAR
jgi:hypothetical protein